MPTTRPEPASSLPTIAQFAEAWSVTPRTVHNWVKAGHVEAIKVDGRVRITPTTPKARDGR